MTTTVLAVHPGAELFGSDRMFLESVIGLVETGHRVVAAVPEQGPLVPLLVQSGATVVTVPMLVLRKSLIHPKGWPQLVRDSARGLRAAWRLMSTVAPDVVYVSTITLPEWPIVARMRGAHAISHVHEAEGSARPLLNRALYTPQLAAHKVLVNSEFSRRTIGSVLPALAAQSRVVWNGVASPNDVSGPREALDGALRVVYLGRLSPRKGPDVALKAVKQLGDSGIAVDFALVGGTFPGYEWFEEQLRAEAADTPTNVRVTLAGFHPDVWGFLSAADVVVVPSRFDEPFGNTAVEAILARRPVVVSNTSGLREAADGYVTASFVEPDDAGAIADALERIRADWTDIRLATASDRAKALQRHSPTMYRAAIADAVAHLSM